MSAFGRLGKRLLLHSALTVRGRSQKAEFPAPLL